MRLGALRAVLESILERLTKNVVLRYRPEKFYMRGPGPKCSEKGTRVLIWAENARHVGRQSDAASRRAGGPGEKY